MPRIVISGSHSTGKSTVLNALKSDIQLSDRFTFKSEILRDIKKTGIKINEYGTDNTQLLVLSKMIEYSTIPNTILDRGFLDCLSYTAYLYEKGQVKKSTLKIAENLFENIKYDIYFYISPEFDIVSDGVRSENFEFRNRVTELFEEYIDAYKIPVARLSGSVSERVSQFKDVLSSYDNCMNNRCCEVEDFLNSFS